MARTTTKETILVWTDRPAQAIFLGSMTVLFLSLAGLAVDGLRLTTVFLMGFVILMAPLVDGAGGLVVGLVGAAVYIWVHTAAGQWSGQEVMVPLATVGAFIAYGGLSGLIAKHLRYRHDAVRRDPAAPGAGGSLGLLNASDGRALLGIELDRARSSGQPLTLVTMQATVRDAVSPKEAKHALRAVARAFESSAGPTMQPVLLDADRFGLILPNHDSAQALPVQGALLAAAERATFAGRSGGKRHKAAEAVQLSAEHSVLTAQPANSDILDAVTHRGAVSPRHRGSGSTIEAA